jgi:fumarylacetoacetase
VTIDALEPYRIDLPVQEPEPFPYLREQRHTSFDLNLEAYLATKNMEKGEKIVSSNFKYLYWSIAQ